MASEIFCLKCRKEYWDEESDIDQGFLTCVFSNSSTGILFSKCFSIWWIRNSILLEFEVIHAGFYLLHNCNCLFSILPWMLFLILLGLSVSSYSSCISLSMNVATSYLMGVKGIVFWILHGSSYWTICILYLHLKVISLYAEW